MADAGKEKESVQQGSSAKTLLVLTFFAAT
jgi:hypothetical protein